MSKAPLSLLTVNPGSTSLRLAVFDARTVRKVISVSVAGIGSSECEFTVFDGQGKRVGTNRSRFRTHADALNFSLTHDEVRSRCQMVAAIGHRIVFGGSAHREPTPITDELIEDLRRFVFVDVDHAPMAIALVDRARALFPSAMHVACFDTWFHRTMPPAASTYPLPLHYREQGIQRYGFHGLSCESVMGQLQSIEPTRAGGRVIIAHLGGGASMTAVRAGRSVDTTMGFSPTGGLVMGTRSGDLDPSVIAELVRADQLSAERLADLLNHHSGLAALSGGTSDMLLLLKHSSDPAAVNAIEHFCYSARKHLGGLLAVLGGCDILVFTGGIGQNAPQIRHQICAGMETFGIHLDVDRNNANEAVISQSQENIPMIRVLPTDEESVIAKHTADLAGTRS